MGKTIDRLMGRREVALYLFSGTLCAAYLLGKLSENNFMSAGLLVLGFYFGSRMNGNNNVQKV